MIHEHREIPWYMPLLWYLHQTWHHCHEGHLTNKKQSNSSRLIVQKLRDDPVKLASPHPAGWAGTSAGAKHRIHQLETLGTSTITLMKGLMMFLVLTRCKVPPQKYLFTKKISMTTLSVCINLWHRDTVLKFILQKIRNIYETSENPLWIPSQRTNPTVESNAPRRQTDCLRIIQPQLTTSCHNSQHGR